MITRLILFAFFAITGVLMSADQEKLNLETIPAEQFLKLVRNPPGRDSWAKMEGTVTHRRTGAKTIDSPLRLAILFMPSRTIAQIVLGDKEFYDLGQTYGEKPVSTLNATLSDEDEPKLPVFGISPSDLNMGFLYCDLIEEEKPTSVKGQSCRVFVLKSLDADGWNRVFISSQYLFPLKAEFFQGKRNPDAAPVRTLEIAGFKKEKDFWMVKSLNFYGKDWRTKIEFSETKAGERDEQMPKDLFRKKK